MILPRLVGVDGHVVTFCSAQLDRPDARHGGEEAVRLTVSNKRLGHGRLLSSVCGYVKKVGKRFRWEGLTGTHEVAYAGRQKLWTVLEQA